MHNNKKQLAEKYHILEEGVDQILQFVSEKNRNILLREWEQNTDFPKPTAKEIRDAEKEFRESSIILSMKNCSLYSNSYVMAIGRLIHSIFKPHGYNVPGDYYYQHYDVRYITFCIERYLTETERIILCERYGVIDGRTKTFEQIKKLGFVYSKQWIASILHQAEEQLRILYHLKEANEIRR